MRANTEHILRLVDSPSHPDLTFPNSRIGQTVVHQELGQVYVVHGQAQEALADMEAHYQLTSTPTRAAFESTLVL